MHWTAPEGAQPSGGPVPGEGCWGGSSCLKHRVPVFPLAAMYPPSPQPGGYLQSEWCSQEACSSQPRALSQAASPGHADEPLAWPAQSQGFRESVQAPNLCPRSPPGNTLIKLISEGNCGKLVRTGQSNALGKEHS